MNILQENSFLDERSRRSESPDGTLRLRFPFIVANQVNKNSRRYSRTVLENAFRNLDAKVRRGQVFGSDRHPANIELDDVSHLIEDLELDSSGTGWVTCRILDTRRGKNLMAIIKHGGRVGVSARGRGTTKNVAGVDEVQSDYQIEGVDFLAGNPSFDIHAGAEHIFESAAPEWNQLTEALRVRYWNAVRTCGFRGAMEDYLHVCHNRR
jgi:hypothetical protein